MKVFASVSRTDQCKMANIDILNLEDLLIIFNFLTLYDKIMAMR